jgi:rhodanese-related sulfurtransferase
MEILTTQQLVAIAKVEITEIDVESARQIIRSESPILLDVREPEEFAQGHLAGAINVPRGVLEFNVDPLNPAANSALTDRSTKMIVYCRSGSRSALAVQTLRTLGYEHISSMDGGFLAWKSAGHDTVGN